MNNSLGWVDDGGGGAIKKNGEEGSCNHGHNPFYAVLVKIESFQHFYDIILVDFFKGFQHIQLDEHARFSMVLEEMNNFLREEDVVQDFLSFNVACLM